MSLCKYYKQKKIVSYDDGVTWQDVSPAEYQVGDLYELDSTDCSQESGIIDWVLVPGDFICEGRNKYQKEIELISTDNGQTWVNIYPTTYRKGLLIEQNSIVCVNKWEGHYIDEREPTSGTPSQAKCPKWYKWYPTIGCVYVDPIKFIRCASSTSSTLTRQEIAYNPYTLAYGIIGDCVSEIGTSAFTSSSALTRINSDVDGVFNIPSGITSIGDYAFYHCGGISSLTLSNGVTSIGSYAFEGCNGLTQLNIPNSVTSIGQYAFYNCSRMASLTIGSGVTSIGGEAFQNCYGLTGITVNATTPPTLGSDVFDNTNNCPIYVPCDSVNTYMLDLGWALYSSRIQGIPPCEPPIIPMKFSATYTGGVTYSAACNTTSVLTTGDTQPIGYTATSMSTAEIGNCVTSIGENAFKECRGLTSVNIPNSVTSIGTYAFFDCYSLTGITIPSGVTGIGNVAFGNCTSLTSISIPNSVTSISGYAFNGCYHLTSVTIGSGITSIGQRAFQNCSGLTSITINASTPPTLDSEYTFANTNNCLIYVPCGSVNAYQNASYWSAYGSRFRAIPPCEEPVFDGKFRATYSGGATYSAACDSSYSGLTSATTKPSGYQYTAMTTAEIGDCVTGFTDDLFSNCTKLSSVTMADTVIVMADNTFRGCSSLSGITISSGLTTIGNSSFRDCTSLSAITIPNSVVEIFNGAFRGCSSLTSCTIGSGVTSIDGGAFAYCNSLTSIEIPSGVTRIYDGVFHYCTSLTSVTIPSGVTTIGESAFEYCSGLTSIDIPNSVYGISGNAFANCSSLTSVTLDNGIYNIGEYAFANCSGLTSITINRTMVPALANANAFSGTTCPIYVPCESVNNYKSASGWSTISDRIQGIPPCYEPAKLIAIYSGGTTYSAACGTEAVELTSGMTRPSGYVYTAMTDAIVGECISGIDYNAFSGCSSLSSVTISDSVTYIRDYAFKSTNLTGITIPSGVTFIGNYAFAYCRKLTSLDIPDSVTSIGREAFNYCNRLTACTIGSGVTSIGAMAFGNCTGLTAITVNAVNPPSLGSDVFYNTNNCPIYVPADSVSIYKNSPYSDWRTYASRIQAIP